MPSLDHLDESMLLVILSQLDAAHVGRCLHTSRSALLTHAARAHLTSQSVRTVKRLGLAWAAELDISSGIVPEPSAMPPHVALYFLPRCELIAMLKQRPLWVSSESDKLQICSAWLDQVGRSSEPTPASADLLEAVDVAALLPCQRGVEPAVGNRSPVSVYSFGFAVPLPPVPDEDTVLQWGSAELSVAGTCLHFSVSGLCRPEPVLNFTRLRCMEPSILGHSPMAPHFRGLYCHPVGIVAGKDNTYNYGNHPLHADSCECCASDAATDARFAISPRFRLHIGASNVLLSSKDNSEGWIEGGEAVWAPGAGFDARVPQLAGLIEEQAEDYGNGRFVRLCLEVHVKVTGVSPCVQCGRAHAQGVCLGCCNKGGFSPTRYCSPECAGLHWPAHFKECHAMCPERNWHPDWCEADGAVSPELVTQYWDPQAAKMQPRGSLVCQPPLVSHEADYGHYNQTNRWSPTGPPQEADGLVYEHKAQRIHLHQTTLESLGSLLSCVFVPTCAKIPWLMSQLWRSSQGRQADLTALIDFSVFEQCKHGCQHYSDGGHVRCDCILQLPPPPVAVFEAVAVVVEAILAAGPGLDWSEPVEPGEQNLDNGQQPNISLVGECLSELEFELSALIRRAEDGSGCWHQHKPILRAQAWSWYVRLRGSGAQGSLGSVFLTTVGLLNGSRMEQFAQLMQRRKQAAFQINCSESGRVAPGLSLACVGCGSLPGNDKKFEECGDCLYLACESCAVHATRGTCCCPNSNFGTAYSDVAPASYHGRHSGVRYKGPYKCPAQRRMEANGCMQASLEAELTELLATRSESLEEPRASELEGLVASIKQGLGQLRSQMSSCAYCRISIAQSDGGTLRRCSRCKSTVYCSQDCQRAHWKDPKDPHKAECSMYLCPEDTPYINSELTTYFKTHQTWPLAGRNPH